MTPLRSDPSSSSHTPPYSARHTPSKLLVTLRRSFSKPKERAPPYPAPARHYRDDPAAARPTIEQIAMGLHVSRTPHLPAHLAHLHLHTHTPAASSRSASPSPQPPSPSARRQPRPATAPPLPPPPARSALKKTPTAPSSSLTTLDTATSLSTAASSSAPPTPTSARPRWGRLLFGRRAASAGVVGAPASRKAVRFEEVLRVEAEGTPRAP